MAHGQLAWSHQQPHVGCWTRMGMFPMTSMTTKHGAQRVSRSLSLLPSPSTMRYQLERWTRFGSGWDPAVAAVMAVTCSVHALWLTADLRAANDREQRWRGGGGSSIWSLFPSVITMSRHFTASRTNMRNNRMHSMILATLSHPSLPSLFISIMSLHYFAPDVVSAVGSKRFLLLYLLAGVCGGVMQVMFHKPRGGGNFVVVVT